MAALRISDLEEHDARRVLENLASELNRVQSVRYIPVTERRLPMAFRGGTLAQQAISIDDVTLSDDTEDTIAGESIVTYAPVHRDREIVGVAEISYRAGAMLDDVAYVRKVGLLGLALALGLAAMFAAALSRQLLMGPGRHRILRLLRGERYARTTALEIALVAITGTVFVAGIAGAMKTVSVSGQIRDLENRSRSLEELLRQSREVSNRQQGATLVARARLLGLQNEGMSSLKGALEGAIRTTRSREDTLHELQEENTRNLTITLVLSAVLTLTALVLLRATVTREHDLDEAEHVAARSEAARQQIIENLPLGFYTFGPDRIQYSNAAWQAMVGRDEDDDATEALACALHPDEREAVFSALRDAVQTGSGFGLSHRVVTRSGEIRHIESRGVPIKDERGQVEHVVGFSIDVSARVRTRDLLEAKTREVEATNARLRQALSERDENFEEMVLALVKAVEAKDPYTAGHSERVMQYSLSLGKALGLSPQELRSLRMGALIHDIGKIGVPDAILTKPSSLSREEYDVVRTHPEVGAGMIEGIPLFRECIPIVLYHHERLDGTGYPFGLKGEQLSLPVRIVAVADCFDAMTSTRAYRSGMNPHVAIEALQQSAQEGALDQRIVDELADMVRKGGLFVGDTTRWAA